MGRHFDSLVDIVKDYLSADVLAQRYHHNQGEPFKVKEYLNGLLRAATLFEFPMRVEEILPVTRREKTEYDQYLDDYLMLCAQHGSFLATPFPLSAIEDPVSVVAFDPLGMNRFLVTQCLSNENIGDRLVTVQMGDCLIARGGTGEAFFNIDVGLVYDGALFGREFLSSLTDRSDDLARGTMQDIGKAAIAYVEEMVYLMDPANFLIRKEQTQSVLTREKAARKGIGKQPLLKTIMRPHYVVANEDETRELFRGGMGVTHAPHPVRGHWRTLQSEKWVNKRGQRILIEQYFTGDGTVKKPGGWTYQVMVKEGPLTVRPYISR